VLPAEISPTQAKYVVFGFKEAGSVSAPSVPFVVLEEMTVPTVVGAVEAFKDVSGAANLCVCK